MAVSTTKKALVRRFDRELLRGYLNPHEYLQPTGIELLTLSGSAIYVLYSDIKTVCFVKEFEAEAEPSKIFHTRPKMEGLWVRMRFRDGDVMDGILPNNLLLWDLYGYSVTPPEPYSNNQKIFIPREALTAIHVLGVVGSPLTKTRRRAQDAAAKDQPGLFDGE